MNRTLLTPSGLVICGLMLTLMAGICSAAEADLRTISTNGEAVVYVVPDEVIVTLGVQTSDRSLDAAKSANDQGSAMLVKAIKAMEIKDQHIATASMEVEIRYENNDRTISAYVTRRMYMVTVKEINKLEPLISSALKSGANILTGVEFRSTELRKHRDNARSMAIKAAREKAVALARDLECSVGAPRTINESGGVYWGGWSGANRYGNVQNVSQSVGGGDGQSETLPLGQIAVRASVGVTFDLDVTPVKAKN